MGGAEPRRVERGEHLDPTPRPPVHLDDPRGSGVGDHRVPAELDTKAQSALENAAHTCPVHKSLHPDIHIPVRFLFGAAARA